MSPSLIIQMRALTMSKLKNDKAIDVAGAFAPGLAALAAVPPPPPPVKEKKSRRRKKNPTERQVELRDELWPELDHDAYWNRIVNDGFTTIPRTMPHVLAIIDTLTKGKPASSTYLALWCRVFDASYIRIQSPEALASESGFSGERKLSTWKGRMRSLEDLGLIKVAGGDAGEFEHVAILNPYGAIQALVDKPDIGVSKQLVRSIAIRAKDVGATDCKIKI